MTMHHINEPESDPTDYEDPWYEQHLEEWADFQIRARRAEDAAAGLDAGEFETWDVAA